MSNGHIARGDIWLVDFDPVVGHEQAGTRPALIISVDLFNSSAAGVVYAIPITSKHRSIPSRISVEEGEGGLDKSSSIICEKMRSVSTQRIKKRLGRVSAVTLQKVELVLQRLLGL